MKRVDKGWNKMHGLLDEKLPQKKKKNRFFFFLLLGLLPLMGYLYLKATDTSGFSQEDPVLVEKETDKVVDLDNITEDIDSKEIIKKDNQFDDVVTLQPNSKSDNQKTVTQQEINDAKKIISSRQQTDASDEKAKNDQRKQDNKSNQANSNSILKTNNTNYNFAEKINDKPLAGNNENNTSLLSTDIETNDINVIADTDLNTTVGIDLSESNSIAQLDKVALINFIPLQKISSSLPQNKLVLFEGFVPEPILVSNTTKNIIGFNLGLNALTDYISDLDIFGGSAGIFAELEINNKFGLGISGGYSRAKRTTNLERADLNLDAQDMPDASSSIELPENDGQVVISNNSGFILNGLPVVITQESQNKVLAAFTDNLSAFYFSAYTFYNINSFVKVSAGGGVERFEKVNTINTALVFDNNLPGTLPQSVLFIDKRNIPFVSGSLSFNLNPQLHINLAYRHSLENILDVSSTRINASRYQVGLGYQF